MSKFNPCRDFYLTKNKILLSLEGIEKSRENKIDGAKLWLFFKSYAKNLSVENIEFEIWSDIIGFPSSTTDYQSKLFLYNKNQTINQYIKKFLNQEWEPYYVYKTNVFPHADYFGGVPCGEQIGEDGSFSSILEIVHKDNANIDDSLVPEYLKLFLYLSMRSIRIGWLCVCDSRNTTQVSFVSDLKKIPISPESKHLSLNSPIPEIGEHGIDFTILERWENKGDSGNKLILLKLEVNIDQMERIKEKVRSWFERYQDCSPELSEEKIKFILIKNRW